MFRQRFDLIAAIVGALIASSTPAAAEMFKWVNDDGTTTYSNQPPTDQSSVQEFTTIDIPKMDSPKPIVVEPIAVQPQPPTQAEAPAMRPSVRARLPQAVQDPCLRSSDPLCYQKHRAYYRPYVGYTPEPVAQAPAVTPPARGATAGASGGGEVGGGSRPK